MKRNEIQYWLSEEDPDRLAALYGNSDSIRRARVGEQVHLRGIIEFSNHCRNNCGYCGLRAANPKISRYRMSQDEIMECVHVARRLGYGTVVLQAGEDPFLTTKWMTELVRRIKGESGLVATLSLGEYSRKGLEALKRAGADRYLLRFETSNPDLFQSVRRGRSGGLQARLELLSVLRELGYEIGSGMIIGLPGQTFEDLAGDVELIRDLDLDMIGVGPFIPHPDTPLGSHRASAHDIPGGQVPNTEELACKVMALTRILCPDTNIPVTTAISTLNRQSGYERGLCRGANVIMPSLTPPAYRRKYDIYPGRTCFLSEDARQERDRLVRRIGALGRTTGRGRGDSIRFLTGRDRLNRIRRKEHA